MRTYLSLARRLEKKKPEDAPRVFLSKYTGSTSSTAAVGSNRDSPQSANTDTFDTAFGTGTVVRSRVRPSAHCSRCRCNCRSCCNYTNCSCCSTER